MLGSEVDYGDVGRKVTVGGLVGYVRVRATPQAYFKRNLFFSPEDTFWPDMAFQPFDEVEVLD